MHYTDTAVAHKTQKALTDEELNVLMEKILPIIVEKGLKSTTMDIVSSRLGMSKRTLYEIFGSKSRMIKEVLEANGRKNHEMVKEAFATSGNVMEAFIKIYRHTRDTLGKTNVNFFKDMDRLYRDERKTYDDIREGRYLEMMKIFEKGVSEGMFRADVDFLIQSRIMTIQMESLKRMEELFPPDIELQRVYDALIVGMLRSIASPKGMKILDRLTEEITNK